MPLAPTTIARPARWDTPFSSDMTSTAVERLLGVEPFRSIDPSTFPAALPLTGILQNDCRIVECKSGDIVVREGDYGSSAFLILHGNVRVTLDNLPESMTGRPKPAQPTWWKAIASLWHDRQTPERRPRVVDPTAPQTARRDSGGDARIFLQDVPRVLDSTRTATMCAGELFGELAALTRTPRSATVFADGECVLLELRWQGLRDLMRRTPAIRQHVERLYRDNSLRVHLRETPLLATVPDEDLTSLVQETQFQSFGNFDWQRDESLEKKPIDLVETEPLITQEGTLPESLLLVRSGFVRVSQQHGDGHRTITYLGKGDTFGLPELLTDTLGKPAAYRYSLRAVGYADILAIPRAAFASHIAVHLPAEQVEALKTRVADSTDQSPTTSLADYLVDSRLMNGTEAMVIDMHRCTRCDDCVRACATTHEGNPRFVRSGPVHDKWMFAHACMHCTDPVCLIGCPTGAIHREADTGVVRINDNTCIGCGTCAGSCPYSNIQMVEIRDAQGAPVVDTDAGLPILKATKCDLCSEQPTGPACQRACPHDALVRLDLTDLATTTHWTNR